MKIAFIDLMGLGEFNDGLPVKRLVILKEQWKLLLELCHLTQDLNPLWQKTTLQRRLKKLSQPVVIRVRGMARYEDKLKELNHFFFDELGFKISKKPDQTLQNCFLPHVLSSKRGPAPVLMLFYCALLEECGLKVQVASSRLKFLLKIQCEDQCHLIDFERQGCYLKPPEILDLINRGFDFSSGALDSNTLVIEYLKLLKRLARREQELHILSLVHSYLMRYQPFNLKHVSERAVVAYETGDYRAAVDDIRNYFQYKQAGFTNSQLKKIYKLALKRERTL